MFKNINFTNQDLKNYQGTIVFIPEQHEELKLSNELLLADQAYHGLISKILQGKLLFSGKYGQIEIVNFLNKEGELKYLILVGLGDEAKLQNFNIEELGGKIWHSSINKKIKDIACTISSPIGGYDSYNFSSLIASGFLLASYKFDKYKSGTENNNFTPNKFGISLDEYIKAQELFERKKLLAEAIFFARDISNEPANIKTPAIYAERISEQLESLEVKVTVLGEREMNNLGMGALLGVGQGSQNESKLVIMEYYGLDDNTPPVALVGKGVTFDTGGISLKPAANMGDMKFDMCGSSAVVGAVMVLASREAKVNIVGVVGLVENMPSGNAQRPGDIVTTMSKKTVEVLNTDAEGRLVLADAMWYTQEQFRPQCIIDLATLTGAIVIALGKTYAGCFSNDDTLVNKLIASGNEVNEKLWHMPLHSEYNEMIKSEVADLANIGNAPGASSCTAAQFLRNFVMEDMVWAHIDIAGVAYNNKGSNLYPAKGAVGYGVSLLNQFIKDYYEK